MMTIATPTATSPRKDGRRGARKTVRPLGAVGATIRPLVILLGLLLLAGEAMAQAHPIEERRTLRPNADVEISAVTHSISVERWERNEIEVTGEYDERFEQPEVEGNDRSFRFNLRSLNRSQRGTDGRRTGRSELIIRLPEGVQLRVTSVSGSVRVTGVTGAVRANSVSGDVQVRGSRSSVRLQSVSGGIELEGAATDIDAQSVSGGVQVRSSAPVTKGSLKSVSGRVVFAGTLAPRGRLKAESHSSSVDLTLSGATDARFDLSSFSGRITSELPGTPAESRDRNRRGPGEKMNFTLGSGASRVEASSFSGSVRVRPGG